MKSNTSLSRAIIVVSVLIPIIVAILIFKADALIRFNESNTMVLHFFPKFHAFLNSCTAVCLLIALYFIKQKKIKYHEWANWIAVILSTIFLVSYVVYHSASESVKYGDINHDGILDDEEKMYAGTLRYLYYFILITHIVLACVIVPLVLYSLLAIYRISKEKHRKIAKITWPIWLYVAITGVAVYFFIRPYY